MSHCTVAVCLSRNRFEDRRRTAVQRVRFIAGVEERLHIPCGVVGVSFKRLSGDSVVDMVRLFMRRWNPRTFGGAKFEIGDRSWDRFLPSVPDPLRVVYVTRDGCSIGVVPEVG